MEKISETLKENPITGKKWDVGNVIMTVLFVTAISYTVSNIPKWYVMAKAKLTPATSTTTTNTTTTATT
jgi:hypothetical protein